MSFHQVFQFLVYKLNAVDRHSLHTPFLFDLYEKVIRQPSHQPIFDNIEALRQNMLHDEKMITINDFGAGSKVDNRTKRKIKSIAASGLSSPKFSATLFHLSHYINAKNIVELGTSLGINSLYLASSNEEATLNTFEGCHETMELAKNIFHEFGAKNIQCFEGNIDHLLPAFCNENQKIDLVYMDANHRFEPTLNYFELLFPSLHPQSVVVIDDIHWSPEMSRAWKELQERKEVVISVDIFDAGILFFDPGLQAGHYVLEY